MDAVLTRLAENGPWAMVAGFLLWQVITAWTADRRQLAELLTEFRDVIGGLERAVADLSRTVGSRKE